MFPVRLNKFFYKLSVCVFSYLLFGFFVANVTFAQTISRGIPAQQELVLPEDTSVSSCPSFPDLPEHISICGVAKTVDINVRDGVQYAQEPIKGATVAAYLGVKYSNLGSLSKDPNGTGELVGLIERLYTYDITNTDGRFVLPVPRGAGTNGFIFLGFFCGDMLKDLYMINTTQDLPYMPVSLACPPEVIPAAVNAIPAPPSINYANRTNFVSCEDSDPSGGVDGPGSFTEGDPGMVKEAPKTVNLPLVSPALDNTRINARTRQIMEYQCRKETDPVWNCVGGSAGLNACHVAGLYCCPPSGYPGTCCCKTAQSSTWWCPPPPNYHYVLDWEHPLGDPIFLKLLPWGVDGPVLEVPPSPQILSRRDLEGFTHTSMGYSFQAISSLNCGISGCYNTMGPSGGHTTNKYLNQAMVEICNTQPFPPLNCKGPGIELAEPREWTKSYEQQKPVEVYPNVTLGDITLPQYSAFGQYIQEILNKWNIALTAGSTDTPQSIIDKLSQMAHDISSDPIVLEHFGNALDAFKSFRTALDTLLNAPDIPTALQAALDIAVHYVSAVGNFYTGLAAVGADILKASIPADVQAAYNAALVDAQAIRDLVGDIFSLPLKSYSEIMARVGEIVDHINNILSNLNIVADMVKELIVRLNNIAHAIDEISKLKITTVSSNFFPYSTVLNYNINKRFREAYLNRPINDSFWNFPPTFPDVFSLSTLICKDKAEEARQSPSSLDPATYPFNACYGSFLLGEDTYSTQKALFLTTKNTFAQITGEANDPVVSKFLAPNEPVGAEVSPKESALKVTPVTETPKVGGKGYWRLGVVQTMCSAGQRDYDSYPPTANKYIDYPVLGAYGEEPAAQPPFATPAYTPIPGEVGPGTPIK
jgi:hypothetical protein